jgi:RNA polymerase sigma-70 factor (ECF subfamily)
MNNEKENIFEEELLSHIDALHNFAFYLTHNAQEADDLVQETYFKAFKHINYFQDGTNSKAWLFKILKNNFINEYRKKNRGGVKVDFEDALRGVEGDIDIEIPENIEFDPELAGMILGDEVTNALNSLSVEFRSLIVLCDLEDFSYEEISKILGIPLGTVRSRLHRARAMMKIQLYDYAKKIGISTKK